MDGPIFKFWRVQWTEAGYQLGPDGQNALLAKEAELRERLGVKNVVLCNSGWNDERWGAFGVHEYANMDCVLQHYAGMMEIGLFRYMVSESMLGTPWQG
jgi:hypothetical protein